MHTFEHFLTEWKLPQIGGIVDALIERNYIQKIIERAPRSSKTGQAIRIGSFEYINPYNQEREIIDVRVVHEPNVHKLGVAQLNKMREDVTYWFILFNWPAIMKEYKRTGQPIRHIIERVIRHEVSHVVDIQTRHTDHEITILKPTEITAYIGDVMNDIRYALEDGRTDLNDIKIQITKPTDQLITWINSLAGKEMKLLKLYAKAHPEVIERLRKVLYHKFFGDSSIQQSI